MFEGENDGVATGRCCTDLGASGIQGNKVLELASVKVMVVFLFFLRLLCIR